MCNDILLELYVFCEALIHGVALAVMYDVVRIFRRILKRNAVLVAIEDVIISLIATFVTFNMIYRENQGSLRAYIFTGMFMGIVVYHLSVSRFLVNITSKCLLILLQKIIKLFKISERKIISKVMINSEKEDCK